MFDPLSFSAADDDWAEASSEQMLSQSLEKVHLSNSVLLESSSLPALGIDGIYFVKASLSTVFGPFAEHLFATFVMNSASYSLYWCAIKEYFEAIPASALNKAVRAFVSTRQQNFFLLDPAKEQDAEGWGQPTAWAFPLDGKTAFSPAAQPPKHGWTPMKTVKYLFLGAPAAVVLEDKAWAQDASLQEGRPESELEEHLALLEKLTLFLHLQPSGKFKDFIPSPRDERRLMLRLSNLHKDQKKIQYVLSSTEYFSSETWALLGEQTSGCLRELFSERFFTSDEEVNLKSLQKQLAAKKPLKKARAAFQATFSKHLPVDTRPPAFHGLGYSTMEFLLGVVEKDASEARVKTFEKVFSRTGNPWRMVDYRLRLFDRFTREGDDLSSFVEDDYLFSLGLEALGQERLEELMLSLQTLYPVMTLSLWREFFKNLSTYEAMPVSWWVPLVFAETGSEAPEGPLTGYEEEKVRWISSFPGGWGKTSIAPSFGRVPPPGTRGPNGGLPRRAPGGPGAQVVVIDPKGDFTIPEFLPPQKSTFLVEEEEA